VYTVSIRATAEADPGASLANVEFSWAAQQR
jgi:hypothetical protein